MLALKNVIEHIYWRVISLSTLVNSDEASVWARKSGVPVVWPFFFWTDFNCSLVHKTLFKSPVGKSLIPYAGLDFITVVQSQCVLHFVKGTVKTTCNLLYFRGLAFQNSSWFQAQRMLFSLKGRSRPLTNFFISHYTDIVGEVPQQGSSVFVVVQSNRTRGTTAIAQSCLLAMAFVDGHQIAQISLSNFLGAVRESGCWVDPIPSVCVI